ncbi:hypothetical protein [Actinopolymorpha pittospori]
MQFSASRKRRRWYVAAAGSLVGVTGVAAVSLLASPASVASQSAPAGPAAGQVNRASLDGSKDEGDKKKDEKGEDGKKVKEVECDADELIAALVRANADNGARLELARDCTYTLTAFQDGNGLPVITQRVSIDGNGATIVRAANAEPFRIFNVGVGGNLKLDDVTLKGGDARTDGGGGALLVQEGGRATVEDSTLKLNRSDSDGGAVSNFGITKLLGEKDDGKDGKDGSDSYGEDGKDGKDGKEESMLLKNNSAEDNGGAVFNEGSLTVENARLTRNAAGNFGGAVENIGVATFTKTRVDNNDAVSDAGGIDTNEGGITRLKDSWLTDNTSGGEGGGLYAQDGSQAFVKDTAIKGNTASEDGGGIDNDDSTTVVEDSKVDENTTFGDGGGIDNEGEDSTVVLRDSSVSRNKAVGPDSVGGGISNDDGTLRLTNTRVVENFATNPPGGIFTNNDQVTVDDESKIIKNRPTNCEGSEVEVPNCFG